MKRYQLYVWYYIICPYSLYFQCFIESQFLCKIIVTVANYNLSCRINCVFCIARLIMYFRLLHKQNSVLSSLHLRTTLNMWNKTRKILEKENVCFAVLEIPTVQIYSHTCSLLVNSNKSSPNTCHSLDKLVFLKPNYPLLLSNLGYET